MVDLLAALRARQGRLFFLGVRNRGLHADGQRLGADGARERRGLGLGVRAMGRGERLDRRDTVFVFPVGGGYEGPWPQR